MKSSEHLLSSIRIALGSIFFWAGIDKIFGLGFATIPERAWIQGGSPTQGFLTHTQGLLAPLFTQLAGSTVVDVLFITGLVSIGLCLIFGIGVKIAGYSGVLLMALIYLSLFPLQNNPLIDEHIIYIFLLLLFATSDVGSKYSLAHWWKKTGIVKKYSILQ